MIRMILERKGLSTKITWITIFPGPFYFAPQRETRSDVVLVSNHNLTPAMLFSQ